MKSIVSVIFLFSSCVSPKARIEKSTEEILSAIRTSNITVIHEKMGKDQFDKDSFGNTETFLRASQYITKYQANKSHVKYNVQSAAMPITVTVPIFDGFDSSIGLKSAVLVLLFTPRSNFFDGIKLSGYYLNEKVDVVYRRYLFSHRLLQDDTDSLLSQNQLDSSLEKESKSIPMW